MAADASIALRRGGLALPAPLLLLLAVYVLAAGLLAWPGLAGSVVNWTRDEFSHGWLIPPIAAYVVWLRWPSLAPLAGSGGITALAVVVLGLLLAVFGRAAWMLEPQALGFVVLLWGGAWLFFGWRGLRLLAVPIGILLFAMPFPDFLYFQLSTELQAISSRLGATMLHLLGVSVYLDGNVIDLGVMKLMVAEACSGLRYLFPLAAFAFICAWLFRGPFWARVLIVLAALPITVVTNSGRIAMTGLFVEHGSIELAQGFLHLFEGWAIFLVALALLFVLMAGLRLLATGRASFDVLDFERLEGRGNARPPQQARSSLAATTGAALVTLTALGVTTAPMGEAVIPERPGLATFPLTLGEWQGHSSSIPPEIIDVLKADDWLNVDYSRGIAGEPPVNLWIAYYDNQRKASIHSPRVCLPGAGWEFAKLDTVTVETGGRSFEVNRALIVNGESRLLSYFWYEQRGEQYVNETAVKLSVLRDALITGRSDGALIRVMTVVSTNEAEAEAAERLTGLLPVMIREIDAHLR